jgi:hypothetical protein
MERKETTFRSWPNQLPPQTRYFFKTLCTNMTANSSLFAVRKVASDDLDLVHASKRGDLAAFEQLVKRYDRRLLRISQTVTHNGEDSEDATLQNSALKKKFHWMRIFRRTGMCSLWTSQIEPRIRNNSGHLNCETSSSEP